MPSNGAGQRIASLKDRLIAVWIERVHASIPASRALEEQTVVDNVPTFLDGLSISLRKGPVAGVSDDMDDVSRIHGRQRSSLVEYSLHEMLFEYRLLREVLFQVLEEEAPLTVEERDTILIAVEEAMAVSGAEFIQAVQAREVEALAAVRHELERSEARFRQIANALPLIIWTGTPEFHIDWYNDWWYQYLGLPRGTRWDDPGTQPMHPEDVERTRPKLREAVETGSDFLMEQRFRRGSDGQYRWHLVRGVPIRDSNGRIVKWIGGNTDIHDQKTVTARLEEEHELRERFVATLSHDLRSPLTAARANAQMLARRGSDPNVLHKLSARIVENLDRADQMIRDLLDANRIRAGEPLPLEIAECDLAEVARETLEELSLVHGDRFVLEGERSLRGHWSCEAMRRIIDNLCSNAVKYGAGDHPVTVRVRADGEDAVSISVHNVGNPIPPEAQKLLFQQYRRLESPGLRSQRGWGLGLTLVEGLVRAHHGSVRFESSAAAGTTFTITAPRDARSDAPNHVSH